MEEVGSEGREMDRWSNVGCLWADVRDRLRQVKLGERRVEL